MPPELTTVDWIAVRHAYEHTEQPVEHICLEHGIGTGTLRDRMRRWKWTRRRQSISPEGPPSAPPCEPALSLSAAGEWRTRTVPIRPAADQQRTARPRADRAAIAGGDRARAARDRDDFGQTWLQRPARDGRRGACARRPDANLARVERTAEPLPTADGGRRSAAPALRAELARKIDGIIAQRPQRAAAEAQSAETLHPHRRAGW
jgi:hypothetical protein